MLDVTFRGAIQTQKVTVRDSPNHMDGLLDCDSYDCLNLRVAWRGCDCQAYDGACAIHAGGRMIVHFSLPVLLEGTSSRLDSVFSLFFLGGWVGGWVLVSFLLQLQLAARARLFRGMAVPHSAQVRQEVTCRIR